MARLHLKEKTYECSTFNVLLILVKPNVELYLYTFELKRIYAGTAISFKNFGLYLFIHQLSWVCDKSTLLKVNFCF